jgi:hypothetical protein
MLLAGRVQPVHIFLATQDVYVGVLKTFPEERLDRRSRALRVSDGPYNAFRRVRNEISGLVLVGGHVRAPMISRCYRVIIRSQRSAPAQRRTPISLTLRCDWSVTAAHSP